ncbi:MAG: lytic transglycosylase domain-containing protein [Candidatus Acidiferrales bacterium]
MRSLIIWPIALVAKLSVFLVLFVLPFAHVANAGGVREFSARCAATYAAAFQVPVELVDAIIQVESDWNPYAVSSKGAAGLMQLMPATAIRFGVEDRFDIEQNIRGGVAYLAWLIRLFRGDLRLAVAAYQTGESPILLRGLAYSSPEVFQYVSRVAQLYRMGRRENARRIAMNTLTTRGSVR